MNLPYKLYKSDCLEILPTLEGVKVCISDPPYGCNLIKSYGRVGTSRIGVTNLYNPIVGDDKPFDPSPFLNYETVILWGANWFADKLPVSGGWLIWDKKDGGNSDNYSDCELAWCNFMNTTRIYRHKWRGMIKDSEKDQKRVHPTQKPISLMMWCIQMATKEGDTIFDPYMGSGTTGVAALQLGRKFIGCEIDPKYFAIAEKRISQAAQQPALFHATQQTLAPDAGKAAAQKGLFE